MSWQKLDIDDLRECLSEDEVQKLDTLSLEPGTTEIINKIMETISQTWRGALKGKGYETDPRDYYVPSTYKWWVLVHCRYAVWSRFPNSSVFAIDDVRRKEYEEALKLLKEPYLDVDEVEWTDPSGEPNPDLTAYVKTTGSSLLTPWLVFPDEHPMIDKWQPRIMKTDIH